MEASGKITAFLVLIVCAFLSSILSAYIITDILHLYKIPTELTMAQIYALLCVASIILVGIARESIRAQDKESQTPLTVGFTKLVGSIVGVLLTWGIAYIMHNILV